MAGTGNTADQLGDAFGISPNLAGLGLSGLTGIAGLLPSGPQVTTSSSKSDTSSQLQTLSNLIASLYGTQQTTLGVPNQALVNAGALAAGQQLGTTNLQPYVAQQSEQINRNAQLQQQAAQNTMASRGLATSPVSATTANNIDAQRVAGITNLQNSLPTLQAQLAQQALAGAAGQTGAAPKGTTTTQTQNQTGNTSQTGGTENVTNSNQTTQQQGSAASGIGGFAGMLAKLFL